MFPGAEVFDRDDDESDISSNNSGSDTDSDDEADSSDAPPATTTPAAEGEASGATPAMRPAANQDAPATSEAVELNTQNENPTEEQPSIEENNWTTKEDFFKLDPPFFNVVSIHK